MRARRSLLVAAVAVALLPVVAPAQSPYQTVPGLSLTFLQPTGTGTTSSSFDVWVRLANVGQSAFAFDGTSPGLFGLPASVLPVFGNDGNNNQLQFAQYTSAQTTVGYGCGLGYPNTFEGCLGGTLAYSFVFNTGGGVSPPPTFYGFDTFALQPGAFYDFLLGTWNPINGNAPAGTYSLALGLAALNVQGEDASGTPLFATAFLASTCDPMVPGCEFTRVVGPSVVTPEPATVALLAGGLLVLGAVVRRDPLHQRRRARGGGGA